MTVSIEYEAEKKLDLPYEKIIKEIVEASLDFEKCIFKHDYCVRGQISAPRRYNFGRSCAILYKIL